jgi:hypothetical protein
MNEPKARRKIRGNIALVVRGGHARIEDAKVISGHRTREAAEQRAYALNRKLQRGDTYVVWADEFADPSVPAAWRRWHGMGDAYVVWADEFVDAGGVYS